MNHGETRVLKTQFGPDIWTAATFKFKQHQLIRLA
jgi:hypothetical protein